VGGEWATCGGDRCTRAALSVCRGVFFGPVLVSWSGFFICSTRLREAHTQQIVHFAGGEALTVSCSKKILEKLPTYSQF
jgi:hypothetical protein